MGQRTRAGRGGLPSSQAPSKAKRERESSGAAEQSGVDAPLFFGFGGALGMGSSAPQLPGSPALRSALRTSTRTPAPTAKARCPQMQGVILADLAVHMAL